MQFKARHHQLLHTQIAASRCVSGEDGSDSTSVIQRAPPVPAARLQAPRIEQLHEGTTLHRVHHDSYRSAQFNPGRGLPTRFAPIREQAGKCVPSLYAASSLDAALYETAFHDVSEKGRFKSVQRRNVMNRCYSVIELNRTARLAALREPDLNKWRLKRNQLISSTPGYYPLTAAWAQAIHRQFESVDGLVWTSNQCDPDDAYLFFGDRVRECDFELVKQRAVASDNELLQQIIGAGRRAGIWLSLN